MNNRTAFQLLVIHSFVGGVFINKAEIDELDRQIVTLLNERATQSLLIRELKPGAKMALFDPKREEEIFARLDGVNQEIDGPMYNDDVRAVYKTILRVMKELRG